MMTINLDKHIVIKAEDRRAHVYIDGEDVTNDLYSYTIEHIAGDFARVELTYMYLTGNISFEEKNSDISEETEQAE